MFCNEEENGIGLMLSGTQKENRVVDELKVDSFKQLAGISREESMKSETEKRTTKA